MFVPKAHANALSCRLLEGLPLYISQIIIAHVKNSPETTIRRLVWELATYSEGISVTVFSMDLYTHVEQLLRALSCPQNIGIRIH